MSCTRQTWLDDGAGMRARRWRGRAAPAVALLLMAGLSGPALAQDPSDEPPPPTIDVIAPQGQDGSIELRDWAAEQGVAVDVASFPWDPNGWQQAAQALAGGAFDVAAVADAYVRPWMAAGLLAPIDICRLQNWGDLFPALRETDLIRGEDGQIYAVPVAWYDTPFVYAPDHVAKSPASIKDVLGPAWRDRLVISDVDAIAVMHQLAVARGFPSPRLNAKQLAKVGQDLGTLFRNARAFVSSPSQAVGMLMQGGADLAVVGGEWMLAQAAQQGVTLGAGFFEESHGGGRADVMAIPVNAGDADLAYAYIDALISPAPNALFATSLGFGAVNSLAVPELDPAAALPYDYSLLLPEMGRQGASCGVSGPGESPHPGASPTPAPEGDAILFEDWSPPAGAGGGKASEDDWFATWDQARVASS